MFSIPDFVIRLDADISSFHIEEKNYTIWNTCFLFLVLVEEMFSYPKRI